MHLFLPSIQEYATARLPLADKKTGCGPLQGLYGQQPNSFIYYFSMLSCGAF